MSRQTPWSDRDVDRLTALHRQGQSARDIGAALGRSRNSVIGKIDRLGLNGVKRKDRVRTAHQLRPQHSAFRGGNL